MSAADSLKVTVYGRGGHGSTPQNTVDPVVLAAMIVVRLQTVVSREVAPGDIAVVTVGSCQRRHQEQHHPRLRRPGTQRAQLLRRDPPAHAGRHPADRPRRVPGQRLAQGSRVRDHAAVPDHRQRPRRHRTGGQAAFAAHFGDKADEIPKQTVSEDFSKIPDAAGVPYTYWGLGYTDQKTYLAAEKDGHLDDLVTNHSPKFLPPMQPTLRTGTEALIAAALAWLAP